MAKTPRSPAQRLLAVVLIAVSLGWWQSLSVTFLVAGYAGSWRQAAYGFIVCLNAIGAVAYLLCGRRS